MPEPISVLVVDDSAFMRKMVTQILSDAEGIQVVGQAINGIDALAKIEKLRPDVVTLDVEMPQMDGIAALREINRTHKLPVVMLSSLTQAGAATTLQCLELGAVDFVGKPSGAISLDIEKIGAELVSKVKTAARTRFLKPVVAARPTHDFSRLPRRKSLIVIGSSTGGPRALQSVIPFLPADLKIPVVVVQHLPAPFTATLAQRLNEASALEVREIVSGETLQPGIVYVAVGSRHLEFDLHGRAAITDGPPVHGVKPSVDVTISSLVRTYGPRMLGVLLTGMGVDGAAGLKAIYNAGGSTMAEHESTCVVYGMPKAAIEMGVVQDIVPLDQIATKIAEVVAGQTPTLRAS